MARIAILLYILLTCLAPARAAEVITNFHSDIQIAKNGEIRVTEKISVIAEGREIRRGIFRDYPRFYALENGLQERIKFDIISIKRNGVTEPYHTQIKDGYWRVYIGEEDVFINRGPHTYELTYETDREIFFNEEDEEFKWNVTGNGWAFPIEKASAEVSLPDGGTFFKADFFTGPYGSKDKNGISDITENSTRAIFQTTTLLGPREGLTIVAFMPFGTINEPTPTQEFWWFMRDFGHAVISGITFIGVGLFYLISWMFIGRDPNLGDVRERQTTSLGISPALAHYISNKSQSDTGYSALSAAILNLAIKGYLTIRDLSGDPDLVKDENRAYDKLPVGERVIMDAVLERDSFRIGKTNGNSLKLLRQNFHNAIENENRGLFYEHNRSWVVTGIILSVAGIALSLYFNFTGLFALLTAGILMVFGGIIFVPLYFLMRRLLKIENTAIKILLVGVLSILLAIALSFILSVLYFVFTDTNTVAHIPFILFGYAIIGLNVLFYDLMGRPTNLGAQMMAQVEGLKLHLKNYHQQRLNLSGTPDMSPKYYEKQLPYAVALDLEKPWKEAFDEWMTSAEAVSLGFSEYDPHWDQHRWYRNRTRSRKRFSGFASQMSSTFSSAMPKPKPSSSSSSGGSSGGGGGGGGGGGW